MFVGHLKKTSTSSKYVSFNVWWKCVQSLPMQRIGTFNVFFDNRNEWEVRLEVPIEMHCTVIPIGTSKVNSSLTLIRSAFSLRIKCLCFSRNTWTGIFKFCYPGEGAVLQVQVTVPTGSIPTGIVPTGTLQTSATPGHYSTIKDTSTCAHLNGCFIMSSEYAPIGSRLTRASTYDKPYIGLQVDSDIQWVAKSE